MAEGNRGRAAGIDRMVFAKPGERQRHPVPLDSPWHDAIPEPCVLCWERTPMAWHYIRAGVRLHVIHDMCRSLKESQLSEARN